MSTPLWPTALSALILSTSVLAEPQVFVSINPNSYSPGQNISKLAPGATLETLGVKRNPDPNYPHTFVPKYSFTVFAQPVDPTCSFFGIPCAQSGSNVIGHTGSAVPATSPVYWGEENAGSGCVAYPFCIDNSDVARLKESPVLRVSFAAPTDQVTALIVSYATDGGGLEAFDSSGQSLAMCVGVPPGFPTAGCAVTVGPGTGVIASDAWTQYTISRPSADISFVLIGGYGNVRPVSNIAFNSPVSVQFAGLLSESQHFSISKTLIHMVRAAQTYYEVTDISATCSTLLGFATSVSNQSGGTIDSLLASRLVVTATGIESALGCGS